MLYWYTWKKKQRQKNCTIVRVVTEGASLFSLQKLIALNIR